MAKAYLTNSLIRIVDFDSDLESKIQERLSYTDKSKQYQLRKMQRRRFYVSSSLLSQVESEVNGSVFEKINNEIVISSGFAYLLKEFNIPVESDDRADTGEAVSLPWKNSTFSFQLRDYQEEALDLAVNNWRGIINFATGLGKTKTAIGIIRKIKRKTLIICPNKSIANQFKEELESAFGSSKVGFIGDGKFKPNVLTVGIVQSVVNKIDEIKKLNLGLIITDETHHTPANTFFTIAKELSDTGRVYGLTATSYRSDGKDILITAGCGDILVSRDVSWGVENGWLSKPYFIVRSVKTTGQDFKDDKLKNYKQHVLRSNEMNDRITSDAEAFIKAGKPTLILVDQIEHGELLASKLQIPFANGKDENSGDLIDDFNDGKIVGLVATDGVVGEGIDTRTVETLILANFVASKGPVIQAVGRALRKTPTKDKAIILDYIPEGSSMLSRHARQRITFYKEITHNVKIV